MEARMEATEDLSPQWAATATPLNVVAGLGQQETAVGHHRLGGLHTREVAGSKPAAPIPHCSRFPRAKCSPKALSTSRVMVF